MNDDDSPARLYYLFGAARTHLEGPERSSWLARLPASLFAIPVGLFGLAGAWQRIGVYAWPIATDIGDLLLWFASIVWGVSLLLYIFKCSRYPQAVLQEFTHPVQSSLQALLPLSILLAAINLGRPDSVWWLLIVIFALGLQGIIAFHVVSTLATGQLPVNAITPALYLPAVGGGLVGGMAMAALHFPGCGALLFGIGLAGWALLEARVLNRLFQGTMPEALRPTIGVELAPPAIATLAASAIWPELPGNVLMVGLGLAAGPIVTVAARYRWWAKVPFSLGFWSFSFPLAALASAVIEVVQRSGWSQLAGGITLLLASAIIGLLVARTLLILFQGRLLPAE